MSDRIEHKEARRRPVSREYVDSEGNKQIRASHADFETLPVRHIQVVVNLPGFEEDEELNTWMGYAEQYYDRGDYGEALQFLTPSIERMPALEPYLFYYVRVCKRVLSVQLTTEEVQYQTEFERYRALPKALKETTCPFDVRVRCKWCGRYTPYVDPNTPTFGFIAEANSCTSCGRMYPVPSWMWDSPDGRAYSYYRMSFDGREFYDEFEQDYDPRPSLRRDDLRENNGGKGSQEKA